MLSRSTLMLNPSLDCWRGRQLSLSCLLIVSLQHCLFQLQLGPCGALRPSLLAQKRDAVTYILLKAVCCLNDRHEASA